MDEIMNIIIKIVATVLALGIGWAGRYLISWLKKNVSAKDAEKLELFVSELVEAAEQMYKEDDPDGTIRLRYVESMLTQAGYDLTDAIRAMIESNVFNVNLTNKSEKGGE